jgi:DNA helicase-2/ATP-dependent DNA helicase PcrA
MGTGTLFAAATGADQRILEGLNDEQREAVLVARGPVCILAGAGSGKTTTITRRIAHQVSTGTFSTEEILAVTFTDKAAREMAARLARLGAGAVRARTFHAEALAQYRRFSGEAPELVGSKAQALHGIVQRLPAPYKFTALRDVATEIEWAKNRRVTADRYLDSMGEHEPPIPADLMHRVYAEYERRKSRAGRIDFEDLLERTVQLLEGDERALSVVRSRYRAFTVDEYQDVNLLQQCLLDAWVGPRVDVCVVGDDYQSIFGFTGASPRYLLSFPERYAGCRVVRLETNYRSSPEILEVANRLARTLRGSSKVLRASRPCGPRPELREFPAGSEEVAWIVGEVRALHDRGVEWDRIAILHRINGRTEDYEEAFSRAAIPFQVRDGTFLRRPAARAVLSRLRHEPGEDVSGSVARIVSAAGYDPSAEAGSAEEATRQADLGRLLRLAEEFAGGTAEAFAGDLRARFAEEEKEGRGIVLLTYHRSKGLEFDAVFLPRLEDKELPFALSKSEEDLAEERRLLYVGITRARESLYLSWARSREGERRARPRPSPFLRELVPGAPAGPSSRTPGPRATAPVSDDPLFEVLREWRSTIAREAGVPAYIVFDNKTLAMIAEAKPATRTALLAVPGVGPAKMARYAEDVLRLVRAG